METKGFCTAIVTEDYEKTLEFYTGLMGFKEIHHVDVPTGRICVIENGAGSRLEIMELKQVDLPEPIKGKPGFKALRTNVSDLAAAVDEFNAAGAKIVFGPVNTSTGKAVIVEDPNGVQITVMQHIKKEDRERSE